MTSSKAILLAAALALAAAAPAAAQEMKIHLRSSKIGVPNVEDVHKAAAFYNKLLGLQEVRRQDRPEDPKFFEIIMRFGATPAEAMAAPGPNITIVTTTGNVKVNDPVAHLVFNVPDNAALVAKTVAAGGTIQRMPYKSASGSSVAFVLDPSGNRVELVTPPKG